MDTQNVQKRRYFSPPAISTKFLYRYLAAEGQIDYFTIGKRKRDICLEGQNFYPLKPKNFLVNKTHIAYHF